MDSYEGCWEAQHTNIKILAPAWRIILFGDTNVLLMSLVGTDKKNGPTEKTIYKNIIRNQNHSPEQSNLAKWNRETCFLAPAIARQSPV